MRFEYCNNDNQTLAIDVNLSDLPAPLSIELKPLDNKTLHSIPGCDHRVWQSSDWWIMKDGKINVSLFHERAYFPYDWTKKSHVDYWLTDTDFRTPLEAVQMIHSRGCDVSKWYAQTHFYADHQCYFIVTQDFNEALKFLGYSYSADIS